MDVVATITSKYGGKVYSKLPIGAVADYQIDSAMDTDTDAFSVNIGDPTFQLIDLLKRNNEVRVGLSAAVGNGKLVPILQGYGDLIAIRQDGTLAIQGRDMSSAAVDTTAIPFNWYNARPKKIISDQAVKLGWAKSRLNISPIKSISKLYTDGSESEWQFWYRMVRTKQMWIWCSPNGVLNVDTLNYADEPTYFFGVPSKKYPHLGQWIRVSEAEIRKNTQTRIGEVWLFGETGKQAFGPIKARDMTIKDWIKKPLHIVTANAATTSHAQAVKDAHEEIFESIVGSLEITIRIPDPGQPIRQNTTCMVNLPKMGFSGEFFVVGVQLTGGSDGAIQEVRLREKKYALTRRVPNTITMSQDGLNTSGYVFGGKLTTGRHSWGEYFFNAAKAHHGGWDLKLFLATLLAICDRESSFSNVREGNSSLEWSEPPTNQAGGSKNAPSDIRHHGDPGTGGQLAQWRADFANDPGNPYNPFHRDAGVGPMQLTTHSYKTQADQRVGIVDEYVGGRWHPEANIWVGAAVLQSKLQGLPQNDASFWLGVERYNGSGPAAIAYMQAIKQAVTKTWLPEVTTAITESGSLPANSAKTIQDFPTGASNLSRRIINYCERQLGKPYRSGAEGPNAFDCSGLAYAAYASAGLGNKIGGRQPTYGYWQNGKGWGTLKRVVEKSELMPGDMVFFDNHLNEAQPGHMGVYRANGQMIVAPSTGDVVKVQSVSVSGLTFMGGMRLPDVWPQTTHPVGTGW